VITASLQSVARIYGGRTIFRDLSWAIDDGEKIGLIGPSGCGKSTLVRLLAGVETPDAGQVTRRRGLRVAYLEQELPGSADETALSLLLSSRADIAELERALTEAERQMADPGVLDNAERFDAVVVTHARLLQRYEDSGALMLRNRAEGLLRSLGLEEEAWEQPTNTLSGGQRKIVGIARCLLADPDLLLLDEPDNHLDLRRKGMLEEAIRAFEGAVVVVSHDRYLLDEVATAIVELDPGKDGPKLARWEGNYSTYVTEKELGLLRQQQLYAAQQKEIARLEEAIVRFKVWASVVVDERHIKQARNKQRQIDSMDKVERPVLERRKMSLHFKSARRGGQKCVELRNVDKAFGDNIILLGADLTVMKGERVGIVGPNGSGKSVLLKLLQERMGVDGGEVWVGPSISFGYYSQEHETLDLSRSAIDAVRETRSMYESDAVSILGRFLLPYAAMQQPAARLSGGEKSRVQLACLMQMGANCLLLDEPTNNLDIPAAEVLEAALDAFDGTIVLVSHDRYLLDRLVDRVVEVRGGELRSHEGSYSEYAAKVGAG
jgi:ATP-binding cassette subfamily F protein 3